MKARILSAFMLVALAAGVFGQVVYGLKAPNVISVTGTTEAALRAAITRAKSTTGPDLILLPSYGTAGLTLTSPLPVIAGANWISYRGVRPVMTHSGNVPDNDFTFVGGTWIKGDGTFPAFQQQNSAGTALDADKGSPDANFTTTAARQAEISNIGIQNFSRGVSLGAQNQCGLLYGTIHDLWIKDCDDWAVRMANFQHCEIYRIWSYNNTYGFRFYADVARTTLSPGNSNMRELFDNPGAGMTANQLRKHRGLVFEATASSNLNEIRADRIQVNFFARSAVTTYVAASEANTTFTLAAGKGAELQVNMPVKFTDVGGDATLVTGREYYIKTISTDTLTVSNYRSGAAIVTNFTTVPTITTYGFGNMEVIADTGGNVTNCHFTNIDLEGQCQGALSLENAAGNTFIVNEFYANPAAEQHIVLRVSQPNYFIVTNSFTSDVDGSSANSFFMGSRDITNSRQSTGQWMGLNSTSSRLSIGIGSADVSVRGANLEQRSPSGGQFLYALSSIGQRIHGDRGGGAWSPNPAQSGYNRQIGGTTVTATLPDGSTHDVGSEYVFANNNSGIMTIAQNGSGSEEFRDKAVLTSMTIPPATTWDLPYLKVKFMDTDGVGGTPHWWFVEESVCSYSYTPTLTNVTNVTASTASVCWFSRVGNTVHVSGKVNIDPTAGGAIEMDMTLPYPSNLANDTELAGTGAVRAVANNIACILGDTTNDKAQFEWTAADGTARDVFFTFQYTVK